jgi:hypothetical protein
MPLSEFNFEQFLTELQTYLKQPKVFITNLDRAREFYIAVDLAKHVFPDVAIEIREDPLQTGAMIIHAEMPDIVMRGAREIKSFSAMVALADNFEIYAIDKGNVCFAAVFQSVHKRI